MNIEDLKQYSNYDLIPITKEIMSDITTPVELVRVLKKVSSHTFLLESNEDATNWGRYSFIGFDPKLEITCLNNVLKINGKEQYIDHPKDYLRELLKNNTSPKIEGLPPFTGGLVGYFGFDYYKYSEPKLKLDAANKDAFNDLDLMFFDKIVCFDNYKQKIILIVNIKTDNLELNYQEGLKELDKLEAIVKSDDKAIIEPLHIKEKFTPLFNKEEFCQMVEKGKHYIKEGDIFQVVLSNRFEAKATGSLFDTYRILRTTNPSPYMFYFSSNTIEMAGASPETLVKLTDKTLYTFPLAGSRPRGKNDQEDQELIEGLLKDEKELAEHNMLVDLGRNDLGRISKFNSVKVEKFHDILKFSHIMHIGSTVKSEIQDGKDALDAIDAVLPAGTLSGAPKIRACQIINELEDNKRGNYGGAIGYIAFNGNLDMCIGIRFASKQNDKVYVRSGGGIVYDSIPENEYQESINKAAAVVNAVNQAGDL
ncbi:MAG: chorismate-binding protein [Thomasclavelia sp.]|nr:chorismate-binding protein [Thomasclavelia sp.]